MNQPLRVSPRSSVIGHFGWWVLLTYLSLVVAVVGVCFALGGNIGYAMVCLMVCGLCDMCDGPVARKATRTRQEESFGVQIDSLADLVSFGVFPLVIGYAVGPQYFSQDYVSLGMVASIVVSALYLLAALIRLGYFNAQQLELANQGVARTHYVGVPVTLVAIIIPLAYSICSHLDIPLATVYSPLLLVMAVAFLMRVKLPKMSGRKLLIFPLISVPILVDLLWHLGTRP